MYVYIKIFFICCLKYVVQVHDSFRNRIQIIWFFKCEMVLPLSLVSEFKAFLSLLLMDNNLWEHDCQSPGCFYLELCRIVSFSLLIHGSFLCKFRLEHDFFWGNTCLTALGVLYSLMCSFAVAPFSSDPKYMDFTR